MAGKIKRMSCEVCGNPNADAHHEDYKKVFEVKWLCKPHHWIADEQRRKTLHRKV
jgi:hypothetical protein